MKLYLSSYGLGNNPEKLQALVGSNKRAAVIVNAQDLSSKVKRNDRISHGFEEMKSLGFVPEEIDLRDYFSKPSGIRATLEQFGLVWIRGGNSFVLRRAMKQSGFDKCITQLVHNNQIVFAGFSAGACVATPTLHGVELVDDPVPVPSGYSSEIIWNGLNLVNYSIAPHYRSDHPESEMIEKTVRYFASHKMPHKTLRDGE